jgi:hypothetical protein
LFFPQFITSITSLGVYSLTLFSFFEFELFISVCARKIFGLSRSIYLEMATTDFTYLLFCYYGRNNTYLLVAHPIFQIHFLQRNNNIINNRLHFQKENVNCQIFLIKGSTDRWYHCQTFTSLQKY